MILIALFVGAILLVAAIRNSQGALFTALGQDVPPFIVWAAAIFAVGVIGYVKGLSTISRSLIALILVVIVLKNYQNIIQGFQSGTTQAEQPAKTNSTAAQTNTGTALGSTLTELGTEALTNETQGIFTGTFG